MRLSKHKRALTVLATALTLDVIGGVIFAGVQGISVWSGIYFAIVTATTVGYGDITPAGWAAHVTAVVIMLTIIPLFAAVFSLVTTTLTKEHVDRRHAEMKAHILDTLLAKATEKDEG